MRNIRTVLSSAQCQRTGPYRMSLNAGLCGGYPQRVTHMYLSNYAHVTLITQVSI